jgi:glycosyltransferase involved in cell wall biosynthesis
VNGVAAVVGRHAEYFLSLGHHVTVLTTLEKDLPRTSQHNGINIIRFDASGSTHLFRGMHGEISEYRDFLRSWDGDIAFFHCWGIWTTDAALSVLKDITYKKVLVSHGFDYQAYPRNVKFPRGLRHWLGWQPYVHLLPRSLNKFDRLVFLSNSVDTRFYYDHNVAARHAANKTRIISSGVDLGDFSLTRENTPRIPSHKEVLVVGNYFQNHKHQELALRAFADTAFEKSCITFIGSERNDYSDHLAHEANKLGISDRVFFEFGLPREQVLNSYLRCDLVVCSSLWESGPIVLLEAMAAKKPFVSTDVGFASTLAGGVIVHTQDEMASEIDRLLGDDDEASRLAKLGHQQVVAKFDWNVVLKDYGLLIEELTEE